MNTDRRPGLAKCSSSLSNHRNEREREAHFHTSRFSGSESDERSGKPCIELETLFAFLICFQYRLNVKVGVLLHVCDVFSAKRSLVSCQLRAQSERLAPRHLNPTSPYPNEIKLVANNHGEAHGKTLATVSAFRSKHTKGDVISDGLLPRFG
jgi:hypothetical protein